MYYIILISLVLVSVLCQKNRYRNTIHRRLSLVAFIGLMLLTSIDSSPVFSQEWNHRGNSGDSNPISTVVDTVTSVIDAVSGIGSGSSSSEGTPNQRSWRGRHQSNYRHHGNWSRGGYNQNHQQHHGRYTQKYHGGGGGNYRQHQNRQVASWRFPHNTSGNKKTVSCGGQTRQKKHK